MNRFALCLAVLALAVATALAQPAVAQPAVGSWQVYSPAHGLPQLASSSIAPDGAGGVWVGHIRLREPLVRWPGGLAHVTASGGRSFTEEPFVSCGSVDALATAPDRTVWMRLSGEHELGHTDPRQQCGPRYGVSDPSGLYAVAITYAGADGVPQLLPREQLPSELVPTSSALAAGLAVDAQGRVWAGTRDGVAVREADGAWRLVRVWPADAFGTVALAAASDGTTLALGSFSGDVATITLVPGQPEQVRVLPRPVGERPEVGRAFADGSLAFGPDGVAVAIGGALYRQAGDGWAATPLPAERDDILTRLAYAGDTWWSGSQLGLHRLQGQSWTPIRAGETPLPSDAINALVASDAGTLLLATDGGAAQLTIGGPSPDPSRARQAFDALWQRTNRAADGTWVWGPDAWAERYEPYLEAPGGSRFVRYYDKTRMEVTRPDGDPADPYYVTNGLLVVELVTGRAQYGDDAARGACPRLALGAVGPCPAPDMVAGDRLNNNSAPSYATFQAVLAPAPERIGATISATLTKLPDSPPEPLLGEDASLATEPTRIAYFDTLTRHNIAGVFWDYLRAQPVDWHYSFGHPITEGYWTRARVNGSEQWVLIQLFERRTLTYTPGNAPGWQVEMGNVGQHYYAWRHPSAGGPAPYPAPTQ